MQVDLAGYAPRYLGGHHQPRSREAHFNDNCVCIALRARSTVFTPDMHEVYQAKWASGYTLCIINRIEYSNMFHMHRLLH